MLFCNVTVTFVYALKAALSKHRLLTRAPAPFRIQGKMNVSGHFLTLLLDRTLPYAIMTIKRAFHLLRPSGEVETLAFQAWVSTSPSGSRRCENIENSSHTCYLPNKTKLNLFFVFVSLVLFTYITIIIMNSTEKLRKCYDQEPIQ